MGVDDAQIASGNILANDTVSETTTVTEITLSDGTTQDIPADGSDITVESEHGTLTINNTGEFTFEADNSDEVVDAMNVGDSVTDTFTYTTSDGNSANLEINVEGRDDAPVIESISANNQPVHTVEGLMDLDGDGNGDYIAPSELLDGDGARGLQFNEDNGNIRIDMGDGDSSMSVDYFGGNAGYKNILGFYEKDDEGNITDVQIMYVDKGNDDGKGGNFDSFLGVDTINLGTLNELNGEVGFFIVPNGYSNSDIKNAIDNGFDVSIDANNKVVFTNPNDPEDTASINKAYYTDNDMSTDGRDHAIVTVNPDGGLTIGMEDLPERGTDQDYDDVIFTIKPCVSGTDTIINNVSLSDVDDANLEGATITSVNFKDGDTISADDLPDGITATIDDVGTVTLTGTASVADYELALESITFESSSDDRSPREFEYTVFDGDKTSNVMEVRVDIGGCSLNTHDIDVADAPMISIDVNEEIIVTQTIDASNVESDTDGYSVQAFNEDGTPSTISTYSGTYHDGFGVNGSTEGGSNQGAAKELGYDTIEAASETLVVSFDHDVSSIDLSFAWKHEYGNVNGYEGERADIEFYKDGELVGSTHHTGGTDTVDGPYTFDAGDGIAFDEIRLSAHGEGDDFLINEISYERVLNDGDSVPADADAAFNYTLDIEAALTDTDGSETLSNVTIDDLPVGVSIASGAGVVENADGSYSIDLSVIDTDNDGKVSLDLVTDREINQSEIDAITPSVTSTEIGASAAVSATASFYLENVNGDVIEVQLNNWDADSEMTSSVEMAVEDKAEELTGENSFQVEAYTISDSAEATTVGSVPDGTDLSDNADAVFDYNSATQEMTLVEDNITLGSDNDDTIEGTSGDDVVFAQDGNDTITQDGDDTIDGGEGEDTVEVTDLESINFDNISNIETLDISGTDDVLEISLDDVLNITDDDNTITITGGDDDSLDLDTEGYEKTSEETTDSGTEYTYQSTNDSDVSITLTVDNQIDNLV
ncbi:VCBS domain-containing protein [Sulfurimonas sp.]